MKMTGRLTDTSPHPLIYFIITGLDPHLETTDITQDFTWQGGPGYFITEQKGRRHYPR